MREDQLDVGRASQSGAVHDDELADKGIWAFTDTLAGTCQRARLA